MIATMPVAISHPQRVLPPRAFLTGAFLKRFFLLAAVLCLLTASQTVLPHHALAADPLPRLTGVNLASGGFSPTKSSRRYGYDYIYASPSSVDYYRSKGMNFFRVPFMWESMQPTLFGPLSDAELGYLDPLVSYITNNGLYVAIEAQNFGRYSGQVLGQDVPIQALADLWRRLADHYKYNSHVLFDIMNEPYAMPTQTVFDMSQAALTAIRGTGSQNTILVEGNGWSNARDWINSGNDLFSDICDANDNVVISTHQYLDADQSGTSATCVSESIGVQRIVGITDWARRNHAKLLLSEFAGGANPVCQAAVNAMLAFMQDNPDVWVGWSWWAGGPWWGSYFYTLEPDNGVERPQIQWLLPYLEP